MVRNIFFLDIPDLDLVVIEWGISRGAVERGLGSIDVVGSSSIVISVVGSGLEVVGVEIVLSVSKSIIVNTSTPSNYYHSLSQVINKNQLIF